MALFLSSGKIVPPPPPLLFFMGVIATTSYRPKPYRRGPTCQLTFFFLRPTVMPKGENKLVWDSHTKAAAKLGDKNRPEKVRSDVGKIGKIVLCHLGRVGRDGWPSATDPVEARLRPLEDVCSTAYQLWHINMTIPLPHNL